MAAHQPHKLKVAGSSPVPAPKPIPRAERRLKTEWEMKPWKKQGNGAKCSAIVGTPDYMLG